MLRAGDSWGRMWAGIILIALGALFLLDKLGYIHVYIGELFATWWPSLIILWALVRLTQCEGTRRSTPFLVLVVGVVLQVGQFDLLPWWAGNMLWPMLLIFTGIWLLVRRLAWR